MRSFDTSHLGVYLVPTQLGELMLGDVWDYAQPLILPFAVVFAMSALNFGAQTGLRLIGEAGQSFRVRAAVTPLMLIAVALACVNFGVTAAVWAQAVTAVIAAGLWWGTFVTSHRRKFLLRSVGGGRHRR